MIEVYYWPTPNGHKITMLLEEAALPYRLTPIDIGSGDQFTPAFLAISPNNRIPAILDHAPTAGGEPIAVFESGAILVYLADKVTRFLPSATRARTMVLEWLFWQVGGLGPMAGQNHHFNRYAPEKIPYAVDRYTRETNRLYGVLDRRLRGHAFVAGGDYSIADMAIYPWIVPWQAQQQNLDDFPDLKRWFGTVAARPATVRAYAHAGSYRMQPGFNDAARKILFGQTAAGPPRD